MKNKPISIEVVGPESSGKSTLVKELAAYYETSFSVEFSRQYLEQLNFQDNILNNLENHINHMIWSR